MLGEAVLTLPDYFILLPVPRNMLQEESHHDFPRDQSEPGHPVRPQIILLAFYIFCQPTLGGNSSHLIYQFPFKYENRP